MIKRYFLSLITCTCFYLLAASFTSKNGNYEVLKVTAPFPMQPIKVFIYPDKDFIITDFGAVNGGRVDNTKAITSAIEACNQSGGGRVVVPAGTWLTGPIHFKSNVNLYLEENAVLYFTVLVNGQPVLSIEQLGNADRYGQIAGISIGRGR